MKASTTLFISLAAIAALVASPGPARAADPRPETNDFILRVPPAEIEAVAARNGLEVVRLVEASPDALGRAVYQVRAPEWLSPAQVIESVRRTEPSAIGMEAVVLAAVPESGEGIDLDQRSMAILEALQDPTEVPFGRDAEGADRYVWGAYVNQPAARLLQVDKANAEHPGLATVAIIDTGVDPDHPLLADVLVPGYDFIRDQHGSASEWPDLLDQRSMAILEQRSMAILEGDEAVRLNGSTTVVLAGDAASELDPATIPPAFGHGTMVAGIIHRVAPEARLMPLKAFDGSGSGNLVDIVRAIYYAVDQGANVINMSFSLRTYSPELMRAINYAARKGVACVAAAGNEGLRTIVYPAAFGNTLGVASTAYDDYLSPFSNRGVDLVSIAAPGEDLVTSYPGGGWALTSGTSFAAPWISGAIAVFADKNGSGLGPGRADYYVASAALSHALAVHGASDGAAGYGRADFRLAIKNLKSPH